MTFILTTSITLIVSLLLIPALFFITECVGAILPPRRIESTSIAYAGTVAIIVPAHNEGDAIVPTLTNLLGQCDGNCRIVVVADNCTDDTADIARRQFESHNRHEVIERTDQSARGKGYALEFGLAYLRAQPPDIVVFVDADCELAEHCLTRIVARANQTGRPAQALYLMNRSNPSTPAQGVAAFAWMVINRIRMAGLYRLFDVTRLTGSGMAFPFPLLRDHFEGSDNIVEDLGLTLQLVRLGSAPLLVSNALVTSQFPTHNDAATTQRARWEHGSIAMIRAQALAMLSDGIKRADRRMVAMALDLSIPPLVMMIAILVLISFALIIPAMFSIAFPLVLASTTTLAVLLCLGVIWIMRGQALLPLSDFGGIFMFILQKLRIYGGAGRRSAKTWTRTDRDQ